MSQHVVYSNGLRGSQIPFDNANFRPMPMDLHGPMRGQYGPESHLPGPRAAPLSFEVHDPRVMPYRGLDQGRSEMFSTDTDSALGQNRVVFDSQRVEQPRQVRTVPAMDNNSRYYGHSELESAGQTSGGSWAQLSFDPQLAADLNTIPNSQSGTIGLESTSGPSSVSSVPPAGLPGPTSVPSMSPKSSIGRDARSSTRASESSSNSDNNLSTTTTAVGSTSDSDSSQMFSRIASIVVNIQEDQTALMRMMEKIVVAHQQMAIANKDVATATSTRLSDFRDHVDKKFERSESRLEMVSDELWERLGQSILESKRIRDLISGNDPRRTPPNDDINQLFEPTKRRRFDD